MTKDDWYFLIAFLFAAAAFFGVDWRVLRELLKGASVAGGARQVLVLLLILASLAMSALGWYKSSHPDPAKPLDNVREMVSDQTFVNERVVIDGKMFKHCKFKNVSLVYNGTAAYGFDDVEFNGIHVQTESASIGGAIKLLKALNMLRPDLPVTDGPERKPFTIPTN